MIRPVERRLAILFGALMLVAAGCSKVSDGPLRDTSGIGSWSSAPVKVGQFLVITVIVPRNASGHEAVLERLEPVHSASTRGLEMRYAAVRNVGRCRAGAARDWPPLGCRGELEPVNGFRVGTGEHALILVGARSQTVGRWWIPDFRLHYRIGDRRYETSYAQGMKVRVVRRLGYAESSASFSSFVTQARNIGCAFLGATRALRCELRSGPCYELRITGRPSACADDLAPDRSARALKPRETWLYRGFRCYAGRASIRCRNQVFEGFFLSERRSHHT